MTTNSELDVMKIIEENLSQISDPATRDRILNWAWAKFSSQPHDSPVEENKSKSTKKTKSGKKAGNATKRKTGKSKPNLTIVKDLNLKPNGKKAFVNFAKEKAPNNDNEKCTVSVYYLKNELGETVSSNHVYTCFKDAGWRLPVDLYSRLRKVASANGWLDTSDGSDIKITPHGENLIEHDLPR